MKSKYKDFPHHQKYLKSKVWVRGKKRRREGRNVTWTFTVENVSSEIAEGEKK